MATGMHINFQMKMKEIEHKFALFTDNPSSCFTTFIHSLHVTTSIYPVPSICAQDQISDWFASLAECLHWNVRKKQKAMDELSDLSRSSSMASENVTSVSSLALEGNGTSSKLSEKSVEKADIAKV